MRGYLAPVSGHTNLTRPLISQQNRSSICCSCRERILHDSARNIQQRTFHSSHHHEQSAWSAAAAAHHILNEKTEPTLPGGVKIDPFKTVAKEMKFLAKNMRSLIGSGHPILDTVAKYYTQSEGKHIRPMLVLLMSQATAHSPKSSPSSPGPATDENSINNSISPSEVLSDINPSIALDTDEASVSANNRADSDILPSQRRLAEITELIHTASLLHDDVIDISSSRRSLPSANVAFGNKMAVLAGDFLLGRASVALARLRSPEVTELLATVIANLIEGEFMQLRNTANDEAQPEFSDTHTMNYYLSKTYLKTASLISKSCRAAALLGNATPTVVEAAYSYGKNIGLAFQLVDDMLDYTTPAADSQSYGKPSGADLELGLATAPLLFAWRARPELGELVGRKFSGEGDVARAREMVLGSEGIEQTRALAQQYADEAARAIEREDLVPGGEAKEALRDMCARVMERRK